MACLYRLIWALSRFRLVNGLDAGAGLMATRAGIHYCWYKVNFNMDLNWNIWMDGALCSVVWYCNDHTG